MFPYSLKLHVPSWLFPYLSYFLFKLRGSCEFIASVCKAEKSWKVSSWLWFPGSKCPCKNRGLFLDRKLGKVCGLRRDVSFKKLESICWGPGRGRRGGGHRSAFQERPVLDCPDSRWLNGEAGGGSLWRLCRDFGDLPTSRRRTSGKTRPSGMAIVRSPEKVLTARSEAASGIPECWRNLGV